MMLNQVFAVVTSEAGQYQVGNNLMFGVVQNTIKAAAQVTQVQQSITFFESINRQDRAQSIRESKLADACAALSKAADHASCLHAKLDEIGIAVQPRWEPTSQLVNAASGGNAEALLEVLAKAQGKSVAQVKEERQDSADKKVAALAEAVKLAEAEFYAAHGDAMEVEVRAVTVQRALEQAIQRLSSDPWLERAAANAVLLAAERDALERYVEAEENAGSLGMQHNEVAPPPEPKAPTRSNKRSRK